MTREIDKNDKYSVRVNFKGLLIFKRLDDSDKQLEGESLKGLLTAHLEEQLAYVYDKYIVYDRQERINQGEQFSDELMSFDAWLSKEFPQALQDTLVSDLIDLIKEERQAISEGRHDQWVDEVFSQPVEVSDGISSAYDSDEDSSQVKPVSSVSHTVSSTGSVSTLVKADSSIDAKSIEVELVVSGRIGPSSKN